MRRQIVTKQVGGQSKNGQKKGYPGDKLVTNSTTSKPKGGNESSAARYSAVWSSSVQNNVNTGDPLIDEIGKAITNLKMKVTGGIEKRIDEAFRKLQEEIRKGSGKDVSDALTSLEAISKSQHDRDLIGLLKTLKERTEKGNSTESGISGGHDTSLQDSIVMWLVTLKNDIQTGSCTLSIQEDTPTELKKTRDLLQEITNCLRENYLRQTRENNSLIEEIENLDKEIAELTSSKTGSWKEGDIHWKQIKHLRHKLKQVKVQPSFQPPKSVKDDREKYDILLSKLANQERKIQDIWTQFVQTPTTRPQDHLAMLNKRQVETVKADREREGKMSSKLVYQERKIKDIWTQFKQTPTTRSLDHLAMLNDIEKYLNENEREIEKLHENEKILHEHIDELQNELETSDHKSNLKGIQETGIESKLVKKVILIRKQIRCRMENRVKVAGTETQRFIQTQVIDVWNLLFSIENTDPKDGADSKDVNTLLGSIYEELNKLDKTVLNVEESCHNIYQSLFGSNMPVQRKNTTKNDRLKGIVTVLTMCKEEAESICRSLIQFNSTFDANVKGSLSRQCEHLKVTIERYESLQNNLTKRVQEKAELLTRLSQMAGAYLTNNNPNIADLSDRNRPTKLGEMYTELYDNAWTDAFEALDKSGKDDKDKEQTNIQVLLEILSESYKTCEDVSMRQQQAIMAALTDPTAGLEKAPKDISSKKYQPSALQSKAVTDLRKLSADTFVPSVQLFFEENCLKEKEKGSKKKRSIWVDNELVKKYTMKCIELCWLMHIQAPPVHIDLTGQPDDKFDTNKFKQYTKSGNKIHFVVWPPLLLHEEGPLLSKGVAQGK